MSGTGQVVPPAMASIVMKLLRRDPAQRFQSARELREALLRVAEGGGDTDVASLKVLTDDEGVKVEVREGRSVVAEGPTPLVANGLAPGSYSVEVRDPRYEGTETTVALGPGTMQDVTLVTSRRTRAAGSPPKRRSGGGAGKIAAGVVLLATVGAVGWAQPWGRSVDLDGLTALAERGAVRSVWVTEGGIEGGVRLLPIEAASGLLSPVLASVAESDIPEAVRRLQAAGATVDASWEIHRLRGLATDAQERGRYFGVDGGDVASYALRLRELAPDSPEAASLLLKVGERMAWDASAALREGEESRAAELVSGCLDLVPGHPRCSAVADEM